MARSFRDLTRPLGWVLFGLAVLHLWPATKHLSRLFDDPSLDEGWKGVGAALAVLVFLVPRRLHARAFRWLWREHRPALRAATAALALIHAVPATDHVPAFLVSPSWADGWRGAGASLAVLWFLAPLRVQAKVIARGHRVEAALAALTRRVEDGMSKWIWGVAIGGVAVAVMAFMLARLATASWARADATTHSHSTVAMSVPQGTAPIVLDGELDELLWRERVARTGAFASPDDVPVHPYSEARFVWERGALNVGLYAADENISTTDSPDAFELNWSTPDGRRRVLRISPRGEITDESGRRNEEWERLVRRGTDLDGTLDDGSDDDEEWVVELAIPFELLGIRGAPGERLPFSVRRCDRAKGRETVCGAWPRAGQGELTLGP